MAQHLLPAERLQVIRQTLIEDGSVRVASLAEALQVSEVTVRGDLSQLEREGFLKRTYGGAVIARGTRFERPFAEQQEKRAVEKRRIGAAAAAMVEDGDTIILDVGTTTTEIARHLPMDHNLVIVTNGLNIASELERYSNATVMVTGGTLRPMQHSLVNPYGTHLLTQVHADKLFLGCNGVCTKYGVTNSNLAEAEIKKAMIAAAKLVILIADSTKIGTVAVARVCALQDVDCLVTDTEADPVEIQRLRDTGVSVVVA